LGQPAKTVHHPEARVVHPIEEFRPKPDGHHDVNRVHSVPRTARHRLHNSHRCDRRDRGRALYHADRCGNNPRQKHVMCSVAAGKGPNRVAHPLILDHRPVGTAGGVNENNHSRSFQGRAQDLAHIAQSGSFLVSQKCEGENPSNKESDIFVS